MLAHCLEVMAEPMSFDLDYQHMNGLSGFGGLLSPIGADNTTGTAPDLTPKSEDELTLLNISSNKPLMTTASNANYGHNPMPTSPENIDHLLKIIESNDKQNERMVMQYRLKQVLLDYLKTRPRQGPTVTTDNTSPSLSQHQNHCIQALETDCQRVPNGMTETKNPVLNRYPIGGQSPPILTPPISPDISQPFFISSGEQKTPTNMQLIGLNNSVEAIEAIECQQLSETIEHLYSPESDEHNNNQISIDRTAEDLDDSSEDNNAIESCFDETFNYESLSSANCSAYSNTSQSSPKYNGSPIEETNTKKSTVRAVDDCHRNRKASTQSCPDPSAAAQKRSAHLSAEFRYRTKLNDKITKLRNIVGPKSQLSKSGVLSRSIDLIAKLQKSNIKLKEENKRVRILLMQACNQMPSAQAIASAGAHSSPHSGTPTTNNNMFFQ